MYEDLVIMDILSATLVLSLTILVLGYITHRKAQKIHQELVDEGFYDDD